MDCGYSSCGYSSAGGYSGSAQADYSPLESAVSCGSDYSPSVRMSEEELHEPPAGAPGAPFREGGYIAAKSQQYAGGMYLSRQSSGKYYFSPDRFLNNTPTEFIKCGDESQKNEVRQLVEEAFETVTGNPVPGDIAIRICSGSELRKIHELHGGKWSPGIMGFSINKRGFGASEVFVREGELARLMLTLGHEIGHVASLPMKDPVDEEAKAFAFSMAWMNAIKENNIGNLSGAISPMPAKNGLHNVAFDFVADLIRKGRKAMDVYLGMIKGMISISSRIPDTDY